MNEADLIEGLKRQAELMESNAKLLERLYPESGHYLELRGAAAITRGWIKGIQDE